MSELLENKDNLMILESLVKSDSVSINFNELGRILSKNRGTIQDRVEKLIEKNIVEPPSFPFIHLFSAFPLLTLINMDIPDCIECEPRITKWIQEDPRIIAAYKFRQGKYGTLIFSLHMNLKDAHEWMAQIPSILENEYHVEKKHATFNSNTIYVSNQLLLKYDPSTGINILERDYKKGERSLNGYTLDKLDLSILRYLMAGKGVKYNRNTISISTGLHSKTIENRIESLLKNKVLLNPVCRFPQLFVPPGYMLSYMLAHVEYSENTSLNSLLLNENIPIIWKVVYSKYNLLMLHVHKDLHDLYGDVDASRESYKILEKAQTSYLSHDPIKGFNLKKLSLDFIHSKLYPTVE